MSKSEAAFERPVTHIIVTIEIRRDRTVVKQKAHAVVEDIEPECVDADWLAQYKIASATCETIADLLWEGPLE